MPLDSTKPPPLDGKDIELLDDSDLVNEAPPPPPPPPLPSMEVKPPQPPKIPQAPVPSGPVQVKKPVMGGAAAKPDLPFGAPQAGVRLVVLDGPNKGEEYSIDSDSITIGRGADNDIVLKDISASRKHVRISKEGEGFRIEDLGSGNGTLLGSEKISEHDLASGMVFKIGTTSIRFIRIGDIYSTNEEIAASDGAPVAAAPAASPKPGKAATGDDSGRTMKVLAYGLAALVAFIVVLAGVKYFLLPDQPRAGRDTSGRMSIVSGAQPADLQRLFSDGVDAFKRQDWDLAMQKFSNLLSVDPGSTKAMQYRLKIEEEIGNRERLSKARDMFASKRCQEALAALEQVGSESSYSQDAKALSWQVRSGCPEQADTAPAEAPAAVAAAEIPARRAEPSAVDSAARKPRPRRSAEPAERPSPKSARTSDLARSDEERQKPAEKIKVSASASGAAQKAISMFRQGDADGAIASLESSGATSDPGAQKLLADIKGFQAAYKEGEAFWKAKQDVEAIRSLSRAQEAARSAGGAGEYGPRMGAMMADMYYLKGVKAFYKQDYLPAFQSFQAALKAKPDHQLAKAKLSEMPAVASKLYEEGYVLKSADPEGARRKFEVIIQITSPDNDFHKRAKELLKKL